MRKRIVDITKLRIRQILKYINVKEAIGLSNK